MKPRKKYAPNPVYYPMHQCANCGSTSLIADHSEDNGDGSRTRWTICRTCDHHFKIVLQPFQNLETGRKKAA